MALGLFFLSITTIILASYLAYKKVNAVSASVKVPSGDLVVLQITLPKDDGLNKEGLMLSGERLYANLHGLFNKKDNSDILSFEVLSTKGTTKFFVTTTSQNASFVENQIYAYFSSAQIQTVEDPLSFSNKSSYHLANLKLTKKDFFPIKTLESFDTDPFSSITEVLAQYSDTNSGHMALMQVVFKPIEDTWQDEGNKYITQLKSGSKNSNFLIVLFVGVLTGLSNLFFGSSSSEESKPKEEKAKELNSTEQAQVKNIEEKMTKMGFRVCIKVFVEGEKGVANSLFSQINASFKQFSDTSYNSFNLGTTKKQDIDAFNLVKSRGLLAESFVLNTNELSTIAHFPSSFVGTPTITRAESKTSEPPVNLPIEGDVNFFGTTSFRSKKVKFGIKNGLDRMRHMYFVGKTGVGKSTLFENMIIQDIVNGKGCGYIDPHGDTIEKILKRVPKERLEDIVLIDPTNSEFPVGINVLECPNPAQRNTLVSSILNAFKLQFGYSWGPRLEYLLNYALLTLVQIEGTTLLSVTRLLTDKNYRKYILEKTTDPLILKFWNEEYKELENSFGAEAVSPIQNKVNRLLSSSTLRNILGQRNSTIKFDEIMNGKKILLVNLSKGLIGDDNSNLLGSLVVNRLAFYAMQRASIAEEERVPFYLYVDEFQNFATESFAIILSEARKYGLSLHLTHQYTEQLPETIKNAIFGNVGTLVSFTLGSHDASVLAKEFEPVFSENDLISQPRYHFYCKLHIDGATSKPFSGASLPPTYSKEADLSTQIKDFSANKYGTQRELVEDKIHIWLNRPFDVGMAIAEKYKKLKTNNEH